MFKSFRNFLEEKSLVGNPKTKLIADYEGDNENSPPAEAKKKPGAPYKAANNAVDPNKKGDKKGFADAGDSKLVYTPNTEKADELGSYPKIKTEQFLKKTKKMSPAQFVEHVTKQNNKLKNENYKAPKLSFSDNPHPAEVVKYVTELAKKDYKVVENLIHDSKRNGSLKRILECALNLPETYTILAQLLNDTKRSNKLSRALDEQVGPPMGMDDQKSNKKPSHAPIDGMDHDSDDDMDDSDDMDHNDSDDDNMDDDSDMNHDDMDGSSDDDSDMHHDDSDDDDMDDSDDDSDMHSDDHMSKMNNMRNDKHMDRHSSSMMKNRPNNFQ